MLVFLYEAETHSTALPLRKRMLPAVTQHSLLTTVRAVSTVILASSAMSNPFPDHGASRAAKAKAPLLILAPSDVTIRTFREADTPRVKELFRLGMYSLIPAFFKLKLVYSPISQAVWGVSIGILGGLAFAKRFRDMWAVALLGVTYAGYLRYAVSKSFKSYVDSETDINLSSVSDTYLKAGGTFLVAVDKHSGQIVGMVGGEKTKKKGGESTLELKRMSVDTTVHSRGLGTMIVGELQQHARKLGFQKIVLSCTSAQVAANQLYRKCGFTLIKQTPFPLPGAKLCFYEKKL
jgi:ribosomal protein S18 acetylase RimI-like enzyme